MAMTKEELENLLKGVRDSAIKAVREQLLPRIEEAEVQLGKKDDDIASLQSQIINAQNQAAANKALIEARRVNVRYLEFWNDTKLPGKKDESWITFKQDFVLHCENQGLNDKLSRGALALSMKGAAAMAVHDLRPHHFADLAEMLEAYEKKFLPAASSSLAQTIFEQAVMVTGETVLDFHSRLYALWRRAYPKSTDQTMLIRRFSLGVTKTDTRRELIRQRPDDYSKALDIAQTEEAVDKATRSTALNQTIMPAPTTDEPMDINAIGGKGCFNCGKEGHIKRDCRSKPKIQNGPSTGGPSTGNSGKKKTERKKNGQFRPRSGRKGSGYKKILNMMEAIKALKDSFSSSDEDEDEEEGEEQSADEGQESSYNQEEDF
jgi:hypothetical protein